MNLESVLVRDDVPSDVKQIIKDLNNQLLEVEYKHLWNLLSESVIPTLVLSKEGKIVDYNRSMENLTGYSHEEVPDIHSWFHKVYPDVRYCNEVMKNSQCLQEKKYEFRQKTFEITRKNGEKRCIEFLEYNIIHEGQVTDLQVIQSFDVTDRKKIENETKTYQKKLEDLVNIQTIEEALLEKDEPISISMDSKDFSFSLWDSELRLISQNKKSLELYHPPGTSDEDVIGRSMVELSPELKESGRYKTYLNVIKTGIPFRTNDVINHPHLGNHHLSLEAFKVGNCLGIITIDKTREKLAEDEIRKTNTRHEYILSSNPAVIYTCEPRGKFQTTFMSSNVEEITGYKNQEFIKKLDFWLNNVHPEDRQNVGKNFSEIVEKGYYSDIYRFQIKNGLYKWILEESKLIKDENGEALEIVGYLTDITELKETKEAFKKIEDELKESETNFRALVETSPDGIFLTDFLGNIILINEQGLKDLEYSNIFELSNSNFFELITEKDQEYAIRNVRETLVSEKRNKIECSFKKKHGTFLTVEMNNTVINDTTKNDKYHMAVIRDISERKQAEMSLKKSEERFRRIFTEVPIGIALVDLNFHFKKVNEKFCQMFGFREEELVKLTFFEITHDDHIERTHIYSEKLIQKEISSFKIEKQYIKRNNEFFWAKVTVTLLSDDINEPGFLIMIEDISQQKEIEEKTRKNLLRFKVEEGKIYLVPERSVILSKQVFEDIIKLGVRGFVFSRTSEDEVRKGFNFDFVFYWFSEIEERGSIYPSFNKIETKIANVPMKSTVWIDRLEYLVSKNGFENTLEFVYKIRELAYLKNLILILTVDPSTLNEQYVSLLKKEAHEIEPRVLAQVSEDLLDVLKFVYKQNNLGMKPSYTEVSIELEMSKPTSRKRIRQLVSKWYLNEHKTGNRKALEMTEKGIMLLKSN